MLTVTARVELLRERLNKALQPESLEVVDESHRHIGHEGARDGRGHFRVVIVAGRFRGLRPIARHRLVFDAVGDLMNSDIHALSISALTPEEST